MFLNNNCENIDYKISYINKSQNITYITSKLEDSLYFLSTKRIKNIAESFFPLSVKHIDDPQKFSIYMVPYKFFTKDEINKIFKTHDIIMVSKSSNEKWDVLIEEKWKSIFKNTENIDEVISLNPLILKNTTQEKYNKKHGNAFLVHLQNEINKNERLKKTGEQQSELVLQLKFKKYDYSKNEKNKSILFKFEEFYLDWDKKENVRKKNPDQEMFDIHSKLINFDNETIKLYQKVLDEFFKFQKKLSRICEENGVISNERFPECCFFLSLDVILNKCKNDTNKSFNFISENHLSTLFFKLPGKTIKLTNIANDFLKKN